MIYLLFSADYELFFGENRAPETDVLIEPTNRLMAVCEEVRLPVTLFCDVACLWRYRETGRHEFPALVDEQLKDALRRGHDVQAHVHPHWAHAQLEGNRWVAPVNEFLLGRLADTPQKVRVIARDHFTRTADYFEKLLQPEFPEYRCTAYRAGNYGVQPHDREIYGALADAGFVVDSSVVPGLVVHNEVNQIDFSSVPRQANYFVGDRYGLSRADTSGIFEIPIAHTRMGGRRFVQKFSLKVAEKMLEKAGVAAKAPAQKGTSIQTATRKPGKVALVADKLRGAFGLGSMLELSTDLGHMKEITREYLQSLPPADDVYFSASCHPKVLDERHFSTLRAYAKWLRKEYADGIAFLTFQEAAKKVAAMQP